MRKIFQYGWRQLLDRVVRFLSVARAQHLRVFFLAYVFGRQRTH